MDIKEKIALRLKAYRQLHKWTQEELAHYSNIQQSTLSDIENAKSNVTPPTLEKLCIALGITISDFFDFEKLFQSPEHANLIDELVHNCKELTEKEIRYLISFAKVFKQ